MNIRFSLFSFLLIALFAHSSEAWGAARYWVASTSGTFGDTANWSTTSGGSGGASVPGTSDDAIFNGGTDGTKDGNCALNADVAVNSLTISTGYDGAVTLNGKIVESATDITINSGTVNAGNSYIRLKRNWTLSLSATFNEGTSIVELYDNSVTSTLYGSTVFYTLRVRSAGKTVNFESAQETGIDNAFDIQGTAGSPVVLQASAAGDWSLNCAIAQTVRYISVQKSDATIGQPVNCVNDACSDQGGNDGWTFNAAAAFPAGIPGLVLWLDASDDGNFNDESPPSDGDTVNHWMDNSGAGNDVRQTTAAYQPVYKENILGGKAVVQFDGSNDIIGEQKFADLFLDNGSFSVFFVENGSNSKAGLTGTSVSGDTATPRLFFQKDGFSYNTSLTINSSGNTDKVQAFRYDASTGALTKWANGASSGTSTQTATAFGGDGGFSFPYKDGGSFQTAQFAEILVYNRALTDAEIREVESALAAKWSVTIDYNKKYRGGSGEGASSGTVSEVKYYTATSGTWSDNANWSSSSGGVADVRAPVSGDVVVLNASSGNCSLSANAAAGALDFTGYTHTFDSSVYTITVTPSDTTNNTVTANGISFYGLTTAGTVVVKDSLDINGMLTVQSGTLDLASYNPDLHIAGGVTISGGTVTPTSGTVTLDASQTWTDSVGGVSLGNVLLSNAAVVTMATSMTTASLSIGSGTFLVASGYNLDVNGDLTLAGTLNASTGTSTIYVGGNWNATGGTFSDIGTTVVFDAADTDNTITLDGEEFYNVTFNNAAGRWTFQDNVYVRVNMAVTNSETAGAGVNLNGKTVSIDGDLTMAAGKLTTGAAAMTLSANMTFSGGTFDGLDSTMTFDGQTTSVATTYTLTTNGQQMGRLIFNGAETVYTYYDTWKFMDNVTAHSITLTDNKLNDNGKTVTINGASGAVLSITGDSSGKNFTSTGTWIMATSGTLYFLYNNSGNYFSTLQLNDNVTATVSNLPFSQELVLGTNAIFSGGIYMIPKVNDFVKQSTGSNVSGTITINMGTTSRTQKALNISGSVDLYQTRATLTMTDHWTIGGNVILDADGNGITEATAATLDTNDKNLTITGSLYLGRNVPSWQTYSGSGKIFFRTGTHNIGGNFYVLTGTNNPLGWADFGSANVDINGNFLGANLYATMGSATVHIGGALDLSSLKSFSAGTSTIIMDAGDTTGNTINGNLQSFYNFTIDNSAGAFALANDLTVTNDFQLLNTSASASGFNVAAYDLYVGRDFIQSGGLLTATTANIEVGRNFNRSGGTFTAGTSTVKLTSATEAVVSGSTAFNNLMIVAPGKTVNFTGGTTQTITGVLDAGGAAGSPVILQSTDASPWNLASSSTKPLAYVTAIKCHSTNDVYVASGTGTDGGGNTKWNFSYAVDTPLTVPGLTAWFDASDASSLNVTGNLVDQWNDKSGWAHHATCSGAARPTVASSALNGKSVLAFDGADDVCTHSAKSVEIIGGDDATVFVVARKSSRLGHGVLGTGLYFAAHSQHPSDAVSFYMAGTKGYTPAAWRYSSGWTPNYYKILTLKIDGSATKWFVDGVQGYSGATTGNMIKLSSLPIGYSWGWYLEGYIAEIMIFNRGITEPERALIQDYLSQKWALGMNKYYIGSGSDWDTDTNWAPTSGGTVRTSYPKQYDHVYFNAASPGNVTLDADAEAASINFTGYTKTFDANGHKIAFKSIPFYNNDSGTPTYFDIYNNSRTLGAVEFDGSSADVRWRIRDAMDVNGAFSMKGGTLDLTAYNPALNIAGDVSLTGGVIVPGAGNVTLDGTQQYGDALLDADVSSFGKMVIAGTLTQASPLYAAALTVNAASALITAGYDVNVAGDVTVNGTLNAADSSGRNTTIHAGGNWTSSSGAMFTNTNSTVDFNGASAQTVTINGKGFYNLEITNNASTVTFADALTTANLIAVTGRSSLLFAHKNTGGADATVHTVTGTLNVNGGGAGTEVGFNSTDTTTPTRFTLAVGTSGQTVYYATAANSQISTNDLTAVASINNGNNDNGEASPHWVFSGLITRYWVGGAGGAWNSDGNWSLTSGGAGGASYPRSGYKAVFDNSNTNSCRLTANAEASELELKSGYTGKIETGSYALNVTSAMTLSAGEVELAASGALTMTGDTDLTINGGTLDAASGTLTLVNVVMSSGTLLAPSGAFTLEGGLNITGGTFTANAGTMTFTADKAGRTIRTGGNQLGHVTFDSSDGNGVWTLQDNLTALDITLTDGELVDNAKTVTVNDAGGADILIASSASTILDSTGTWVMAASGQIRNNNPGSLSTKVNLINALQLGNSVTATATDHLKVKKLILGTNAVLTGAYDLLVFPEANDFIDQSSGATITMSLMQVYASAAPNPVTQKAMTIGTSEANFIGSGGNTVTMTGNWSLPKTYIYGADTDNTEAKSMVLDTNTHNLTVSGDLVLGYAQTTLGVTGRYAKLLLSSGTHAISGGLYVDTSSYDTTRGYFRLGSSATSVGGSFTGKNMDIDFGSGALSVGGSWNLWYNTAFVTAHTSTVTLNSSGTSNGIYTERHPFYNLVFNNASGVWVCYDDVEINNDLTLTATSTAGAGVNLNGQLVYVGRDLTIGSAKLTPGAGRMLVGRNWSNSGTFVAGTSSVNLTSTQDATISGNTTFYDLRCYVKDKTVSFTAGSTTAVTHMFDFGGYKNHLLKMRSTSSGSAYTLNVSSTKTLAYVDVRDANATPGQTIKVATGTGTDSGGNTKWDFATTVEFPQSIPGLIGWYDPADATKISLSGSSVTAVTDKSGEGFNLSTSSGPAYETSYTKRNAHTLFTFNGSSSYLTAASLTNRYFEPEFTWVLGGVKTATTTGTQEIVDGGTYRPLGLYFSATRLVSMRGFYESPQINQTTYSAISTGTVSTSVYNTLSNLTVDTGSQQSTTRFYMNSALQGSYSGDHALLTRSGLYIGAYYSGEPLNYFFNGVMGDIAVYQRALSDDERRDLEQWLNTKWVNVQTKYYIGTNGDFTDHNNWSTTAGGSNDTTAPSSFDSVVISGSNNITLTQDITIAGINFTGYTGTFNANSHTITFTGTNPDQMSVNYSGNPYQSYYITTNGQNLGNVVFDKDQGHVRWYLQDNFHCTSLTLTDGQIIDQAHTVTVDGAIQIASSGDYSHPSLISTGTWIMNASGNIYNNGYYQAFYNLSLASGITATRTAPVWVQRQLTMGASSVLDGASMIYLHTPSIDNAIDMDTTAQITGGAVKIYYGSPGGTLNQKAMTIGTDLYLAYGLNTTIRQTGNWSVAGNLTIDPASVFTNTSAPLYLDTNSYNLSVTGNLTVGQVNVAGAQKVYLRTGTHTIGGNITVNSGTGVCGYLDFGTSTTSIGGDITAASLAMVMGSANVSVGGSINMTGAVSWSDTASTLTMTASASGKTLTTAGNTMPAMVFDSSNGSGAWTLQDNITARSLSFIDGIFSDNGKTVTSQGGLTVADTAGIIVPTAAWKAGTGNLANPNIANILPNLTVADSKTATMSGNVYAVAMTLEGNSNLTGAYDLNIYHPTANDFLNFIAGSNVTLTGGHSIVVDLNNGSTLTQKGLSISGNLVFKNGRSGSLTMTGDISAGNLNVYGTSDADTEAKALTLAMNTHTLTLGGNLALGKATAGTTNGFQGKIDFSSGGPHTIAGSSSVDQSDPAGTTGYALFGSSIIRVGGDLDFTHMTITKGTSTLTFIGNSSGHQTFTTDSKPVTHFTLNNSQVSYNRLIVNGLLDVTGLSTFTDGVLDLSTHNPTVNLRGAISITAASALAGSGNVNLLGDFTYSDTSGSFNLGKIVIGSSPDTITLLSNLVCQGLTVSSGDTLVTNGYDIEDYGALTVAGTLNAAGGDGGNSTIWVDGNMDLSGGAFTNTGSLVVFSGVSGQDVTMDGEDFNNLEVRNASGDGVYFHDAFDAVGLTAAVSGARMKFQHGLTYNFSGTVTLAGTALGQEVVVNSDDNTNRFIWNVTGSSLSAVYVDVSNSELTGNNINAMNSKSSSGNTDWEEAEPHWVFLTPTLFWIGSDGEDWNDVNNWSESSGGTVASTYPRAGDKAIFDGGSVGDCVLDANAAAAEILLDTGYTGTLDLNGRDITLTTGLTIRNGSLTLRTNSDLNMSGDAQVSIEGGTLDAEAGRLAVANVAMSSGVWSAPSAGYSKLSRSLDITGGGFNNNNGTVTFVSELTGQTIKSGGKTFYNVVFDNAAGGWQLSDALSVAKDLTVTQASTSGNGLDLNGQPVTISGNFTLTSGNVTAGASAMTVGGNWDSSGGAFAYGTSTVALTGSGTLKGNTSGTTFHDLSCAAAGQTTAVSDTTYLRLDGVLTVNGGRMTSSGSLVFSLNGTDMTPLVSTNAGSVFDVFRFVYLSNNVANAGKTFLVGADADYSTANFLFSFGPAANNVTMALNRDLTAKSVYFESNSTGAVVTTSASNYNMSLSEDLVSNRYAFVAHTKPVSVYFNGSTVSCRNLTAGNMYNANVTDELYLGSSQFNVSGNLMLTYNNGTYSNNINVTPGTSTVTLNGAAAQTITANSQSFNNLTVTNASTDGVTFIDAFTAANLTNHAAGAVMKFQNNTVYTVTSLLDIVGSLGHEITLDTDDSQTPRFSIDATARDQRVSYVRVGRSEMSTNSTWAGYSVNLGDNDDQESGAHWLFGTPGNVYRWTGNTSTDWNDQLNWDVGDGTPGNDGVPDSLSKKAIFDHGSNSTSAVAATVGELEMTMAYPGTVTLNNGLTVDNSIYGNGALSVRGGALVVSAGNISVDGDVAISSDFTSTPGTFYVGSSFSRTAGTFNANGGTLEFNAAATGKTIATAGAALNHVTFNNAAGGWTLQDAMDINGNFSLSAGALSANGMAMTVGGNWTNSGTFTHGNNMVTLDGSGAQAVSGDNAFYGLSISASSARTIIFESAKTQAIASGGALQLTGASGALLSLAASGGIPWNLQVNTSGVTQNVQYVSVANSNAGPEGSYATIQAWDQTSVNGGGNTNWNLGPFYTGGSSDGASKFLTANANICYMASSDEQNVYAGSSTEMLPLTVSQEYASGSGSITAAADIRLTIPSGLNMVWDTSDTSAVISGGASAKVSSTVSYEDSGRTAVLNVTADFVSEDYVVVSGLSFANVTSAGRGKMQLKISGSVAAGDIYDKILFYNLLPAAVYYGGSSDGASSMLTRPLFTGGSGEGYRSLVTGTSDVVSFSSSADKDFTYAGASTAMNPVVVELEYGSVTTAKDIRLTIPSGLYMTWDTTDTSAVFEGSASGKVGGAVVFENSNKTAVISVTSNFTEGDILTVSGLAFRNFSAPSRGNLTVEVDNAGTAAETDPYTMSVRTLGISNISNGSFGDGFIYKEIAGRRRVLIL